MMRVEGNPSVADTSLTCTIPDNPVLQGLYHVIKGEEPSSNEVIRSNLYYSRYGCQSRDSIM